MLSARLAVGGLSRSPPAAQDLVQHLRRRHRGTHGWRLMADAARASFTAAALWFFAAAAAGATGVWSRPALGSCKGFEAAALALLQHSRRLAVRQRGVVVTSRVFQPVPNHRRYMAVECVTSTGSRTGERHGHAQELSMLDISNTLLRASRGSSSMVARRTLRWHGAGLAGTYTCPAPPPPTQLPLRKAGTVHSPRLHCLDLSKRAGTEAVVGGRNSARPKGGGMDWHGWLGMTTPASGLCAPSWPT